MTQVFIAHGKSAYELQSEINAWLTGSKDIKVVDIKLSTYGDNDRNKYIGMIIYEKK